MHALTGWRSRVTRRFVLAVAFGLVVLLGATFAVQVVATTTARAASALLCDQDTIYGVDGNGALEAISATDGTVTSVGTMSPATNGLGISVDGSRAYAFQSGANAIAVYDSASGTSTTVANADPAHTNLTVIRGAVDPVNGLYYYADRATARTSGGTQVRIGAFDPATGKAVGQVGWITGLPTTTGTSGNGDFAFSTSGTLFIASGNQILRVDDVPTAAGTGDITSTLVTTLANDGAGNAVNSPGIAFTTDGYLYVTNRSTAPVTLLKIDPATGAQVRATALSDTNSVPYDLATCNYPDTAAAQSSVSQRWSTTDQFTVGLASTAPDSSQNVTGTSAGTATGVQPQRAGSVLALPGRQYAVTERGAGTTDLAHYTTSWSCTDVNGERGNVLASGTGTSGAFTFPAAETGQHAGTDVVCTFANALLATHSGAQDDSGTTTANTVLQVVAPGVLANDQGTELTTAVATQPAHGTASVDADGSYTYTPTTDFSGLDTFTYTATDSSDQTNRTTAQVMVTVTPVATADTGSTTAGAALTQTTSVLANDHGSTLTPTVADQPDHGTVVLLGDGTYTYTPADGWSGPDAFTYTVTDGATTSTPATVSLTVLPDVAADELQTAVGTAGTVDLLAGAHGSGVHVTDHGDPAHGDLTVGASGVATYTPRSGFSGTDSFTYQVTDASGQTATGTVQVVVGVVTGPDAGTTTADTTLTVDAAHGLLANDQGTALTAAVTDGPDHGNAVVTGDGAWSYEPLPGWPGHDSFTYTATDPDGVRATGTVTVTVAPVVASTAITVDDGDSRRTDVLDRASGTDLVATVGTRPTHGTLTVDPDGTAVYTPVVGWSGPDGYTVVVTDASGQTATSTVTVTVRPAALDDAAATTAGATLAVPATTGLLANDHGRGLTVTDSTEPGHGTVAVAATGGWVYTPTARWSGTDTFDYTVTDAAGQHATATVTITVGVVTAPDAFALVVDTTRSAGATAGVLANDLGTDLTATVASGPTHGTLVLGADGSYRYAPDAGWSGRDGFTYTATDGRASAIGTVTIRVRPAARPDTVTVVDGRTLDVVSTVLLGNDTGTGIAVTGVGTPGHGTATADPDGTVHYTPASGFSGTDSVGYTITDRSGGTATGTITVTVTPHALPDTATVPAGSTLTVPARTGLLVNDLGTGLRVTGTTTPAHGAVTVAVDGSYRYTPTTGFSGTDTFIYTATDASGGTTSSTVLVIVGTSATPDSGRTSAGTALTTTAATGLLANDDGTRLVVRLDLAPRHGTVVVHADGAYTYTPTAGFSGQDTLTYTATDPAGNLSTGIVTITVLPTAVGDRTSTSASTVVTMAAPGVLRNDLGRGLRVTAVGRPGRGTATITADGRLVYTPAAGFSGTDAVPYTVTDGVGGTASATVVVVVTPVAVDDTYSASDGRTLRVPAARGVLGDDHGVGLWVRLATRAVHGAVALATDGSFVYTADAGFTGTDVFTYTTTDADGRIATATVHVVVGTAATVAADRADGTPGHPVTLDVLANDAPTGGALFVPSSIVLVDPTSHGVATSVTLAGRGVWAVVDGKVRFIPAAGFSGTTSIDYRVTDGDGVTVSATATVTYPDVAAEVRTAGTLAFTGGASLLWLALVALGAIALGVLLRRRRGTGEPAPGPRRS